MSDVSEYCNDYIPAEYLLSARQTEVYIPAQFVYSNTIKRRATPKEACAYFVELSTSEAKPDQDPEERDKPKRESYITVERVVGFLGQIPDMESLPLLQRFMLAHALNEHRDAPVDILAAYDSYFPELHRPTNFDDDRGTIERHLTKVLAKYYHLRPDFQPSEEAIIMGNHIENS
jgi:hypothetical protein